MVAAFIVLALAQEGGAALLIDKPGRGVGKAAVGIGGRLAALGIEEKGPAGAEPLQHVVGSRAGRDQLGLRSGFEIGAAETEHPQETAVLGEDDAGRDQRCPWEMIRQPVGPVAIFGKVQHAR